MTQEEIRFLREVHHRAEAATHRRRRALLRTLCALSVAAFVCVVWLTSGDMGAMIAAGAALLSLLSGLEWLELRQYTTNHVRGTSV